MEIWNNYINGAYVPPRSGAYLDCDNPFTGEVWGRVPRSSPEDVEAAVAAASRAFREGPWSTMTQPARAALMRRLGDVVAAHVDELAAIEVRDNGKTYREMKAQVGRIPEWYYFYAGLADKITGEVLPTDRPEHLSYTRREPLGVIGMITPWNSPLNLLAWKLAPALATGNTAVIKPSEFTSASALRFAALVGEAGFPEGVVNVVTGLGGEAGKALVDHPDVVKLAFTGGVDGGLAVYAGAAKRLKPVILELGGKSPNIVFEDANLDNAAQGAVAGIFASGGQSCIAGSRLLVQRSIYDTFVPRVVDLAGRIRLGDPMDPATHIGPVANRPQFDRILQRIEMGRGEGAVVACGGGPATRPGLGKGLFIEPTIFTGVVNGMRIAQEEIFGPALCVIPFEDEADALRIANDIRFGLGAGLWTQDVNRVHRVAAKLQAGTVWVNTYRASSNITPFGGYKMSGLGREGGADMIHEYLQTKSVLVNLSGKYVSPFDL
ncbi:aldehyde dehydrogenase [Ancylobacter mangrovi]|uniref:aldehyde dehydrogenase n=1 Tax=Ancylobacter mangrovi TaxID=2972472 RepID=UPI002161EB1C|nr:aldehyde dehydrogenase [Ancylobacter mangrovi]MCS0501976.1 aldehyde dehydrogenase [Ancylobacter mangrovi]